MASVVFLDLVRNLFFHFAIMFDLFENELVFSWCETCAVFDGFETKLEIESSLLSASV